MIEIHINKDVGSYEAKFIGPFTMRQTICLAIAAPICWGIYKVASPVMSSDAAGFFLMFPAAIAWVFGWTKPYGMRPEKFVQSVFVNMVMAPSNRKFMTDNSYNDVVFASAETGRKKKVTTVVKADEHEHKDVDAGVSKKQQKKPRYKVSPDAVR